MEVLDLIAIGFLVFCVLLLWFVAMSLSSSPKAWAKNAPDSTTAKATSAPNKIQTNFNAKEVTKQERGSIPLPSKMIEIGLFIQAAHLLQLCEAGRIAHYLVCTHSFNISCRCDVTMQVVSVISQKGGSGKTTLALHLAVSSSLENRNTAVIDLDPQASAAKWSDRRSANLPVVLSAHASRLPQEIARVQDTGGKSFFWTRRRIRTARHWKLQRFRISFSSRAAPPFLIWRRSPTHSILSEQPANQFLWS